MSSFRVTTGRDGSRAVFGEHDDRVSGVGGGQRYQSGSRRNSRKKGGYGGYRNQRGGRGGGRGGPNPRSHLDSADGDVDMDGHVVRPHSTRYDPYSYRRGQNRPRPGGKLAMDQEAENAHGRLGPPGRQRSKGRSNTLGNSPSGWFKATIPHGRRAGKDFILQSLNSMCDVPFVPQSFHFDGNAAIFYINDKFMAHAVRSLSRRVTSPSGFKMIIVVSPSSAPKLAGALSDDTIEKLKVSMSNRYEPSTKMLSMKDFYNDPDLKKDHIHLALNRISVMSAALNIIHENIPELTSLDLRNNRLMSLDSLKGIAIKAPNVTKLNLGENQIKHESALETIKDLKLDELNLEGNPMCDRFRDETSYVSAIRKRFPKVLKLDGHDLPPPITFDLEPTTTLPPSKGNYFLNDQTKQLVCMFLDQFYAIYDSDNRQQLLEAYHDNASFSLSVAYNKLNANKQLGFAYLHDSRNLLRVNPGARQKLLKQDRLSIVAQLKQLPPTDHDPASFKVDVLHASSTLMLFVVHGVFKETNGKGEMPPIRSFSRTFLTVPQGSGIVIMNEQFCITNASHEQVKNAFRTPAPTPSSSPVSAPGGSTPLPAPAGDSVLTLEQKQEMAVQFAKQSGMNLDWSAKCLEENSWDFDAAAQVFTGLQAKGAIPPEAFVK